MIPPKEYYRKNANNQRLRTNSYKEFIEKYHMNRPDPDGSKLNERKLLKSGSKKFFIPGKIYTFKYDPLYKNRLDYYDTRPIILCHETYRAEGTKNDIVVGVNFNFLPEKIKVGALQIFYEQFRKDIEAGEQAASRNSVFVSSRMIAFLRDWLATIKIFSNSNIHYDYAYRQYIRSRIKLESLVEYDDWNYIPFIEAEHIMGKPLAQIYKEYLEYSKRKK